MNASRSHPSTDAQERSHDTPLSGGGAIYLQADASDLLCECSREWLRHTMREARPWNRDEPDYGWDVDLSFPADCPGTIIHALGDIPEHADPGFPRHSLLWVLRSSRAVVTHRGGPKVSQPVGTIIAFDCHKAHQLRFLRKPHRRPRLWAAFNLDSDVPWTVESARAAIVSALGTSTAEGREPQGNSGRDQ